MFSKRPVRRVVRIGYLYGIEEDEYVLSINRLQMQGKANDVVLDGVVQPGRPVDARDCPVQMLFLTEKDALIEIEQCDAADKERHSTMRHYFSRTELILLFLLLTCVFITVYHL